ncbi:MAG: DegT/DnrJ/EryC1/StrS aminotransferase family protein [Actinomycetota bacterium]
MNDQPTPFLPLARPDIGADEEDEVLGVLRGGRLALGPKTAEFERLFAAYVAAPWACAVSSGTAGLHLAVRSLSIGPDDCVVTPSFSFISAANALRYEGAEPVFLDIERDSLCLSPDAVRVYLDSCKESEGGLFDPVTGRRVAGVVSVDAFGHPANLGALLEIASPFGIPIVSDSCEALGSRRLQGDSWVYAGTGAVAAVYGFYPNKQITTGEGGMVTGSDPDIEERVRSLRNQGRRAGDPWLHHTRMGFNYRLDELSAALGVAQMKRVEEILLRRAGVVSSYEERLRDVEGIATPEASAWADPAWFVEFLRVDEGIDRDRLVQFLNANGIESKAYFDPPVHRQPPYADRPDLVPEPLPVTEEAAARILIIPLYSRLSTDEVDRVCDALRRGLAEVAA